MPLNSAPNSCAVISRRGCSPSSNGIAYVPCSNRLAHTANPSRSQYRIFTRSRLRLANTNRCPANASSFRQSVTSACNPSKLFRMSHGHAHRYTRTLAGKCIMRGLRELPTPCVALSRPRPLRCASDVPNAALTPPQPFPAPLACPSLPVRIAPEPAPLPAASATDRRTAALRRADGRSFPPFVPFASARRSPPSSARTDPNICHLSWKVSSSPVCSNPSILNSGVHRALIYDLRKLKGHDLLQRDGRHYAYRLTAKGLDVALLFLFFHQRLCGPLANSRFHHKPDPANRPNSQLEAAYHKADQALENIVNLLRAA